VCAPREQRAHQIQVRGLLLLVRGRLRVPRAQRPLGVHGREERCDAVFGRERRVGAAREQRHREVEVAVDDRDEERRRLVPRGELVDVGAGV
jgi:hypothetical protein